MWNTWHSMSGVVMSGVVRAPNQPFALNALPLAAVRPPPRLEDTMRSDINAASIPQHVLGDLSSSQTYFYQ